MADPSGTGAPEPPARPGRPRGAVLVALTALAALLSGCAVLPSEGGMGPVEFRGGDSRSRDDSGIRVWGVSPQPGEKPQEIVRGFLEATTSDDPDYATARQYLTADAAREWEPFARTTVLSGGPSAEPAVLEGAKETGATVEVKGRRAAQVSGDRSYRPDDGAYEETFHLTEGKKGWRIDRVPPGIVLAQSDFERIYGSVDVYFYAELGPEGRAVSGPDDLLVADPVHLRKRIDPVTDTVTKLLQGPSGWLEPVVSTAFPEGTWLAGGSPRLTLDDSGTLAVPLNKAAARVGRAQCARMAAQVLYSVQSQASAKVAQVVLSGEGRGSMCRLSREQAQSYAPGRLGAGSTDHYLLDEKSRVAEVSGPGQAPDVVQGPFGRGGVELESLAVSRDERQVAAVQSGGGALYVGPLSGPEELGEPVLGSDAKQEGDRLSAPSWDGLGHLWIADRDPDDPRLLRLADGTGEPEEIPVPALEEDERVEAVRVASDGVRVALRVRADDGRSALWLGRVERAGTSAEPVVTVTGLRPVTPRLEDVVGASWAGDSRLVVVGRESGSVQTLKYVGTDGSTSSQQVLPGINDVTGVAGSEDESQPLLAESEYGVVRLSPDAGWRTVTETGTSPAYPG